MAGTPESMPEHRRPRSCLANQAAMPTDRRPVKTMPPFSTERISPLKTWLPEGIKGRLSGMTAVQDAARRVRLGGAVSSCRS